MRVDAVRCNVCKAIKDTEETFGFYPETDLFNTIAGSYKHAYDQKSTNFHICLECVRQSVYIPAEMIAPPGKDRKLYDIKVSELLHVLKAQVVREAKK